MQLHKDCKISHSYACHCTGYQKPIIHTMVAKPCTLATSYPNDCRYTGWNHPNNCHHTDYQSSLQYCIGEAIEILVYVTISCLQRKQLPPWRGVRECKLTDSTCEEYFQQPSVFDSWDLHIPFWPERKYLKRWTVEMVSCRVPRYATLRIPDTVHSLSTPGGSRIFFR